MSHLLALIGLVTGMAGVVGLHLRQPTEVGLLGPSRERVRVSGKNQVIAVAEPACHGLDGGSILEPVRVMA